MGHHTPEEEIERLIDPELRAEIGDPVPVPFASSVVYLPLFFVSAVLALFWQDSLPGRPKSWENHLLDLGLGIATALAFASVSHLLGRFTAPFQRLEAEFRRVLGGLTFRQIAWVSLLSGSAEEMFFRGVLQPWIGWIPASLVFGLVHFIPSRVFLPWTISALVGGFALGALYDHCGTLLAPTVAHILVNLISLTLIIRPQHSR